MPWTQRLAESLKERHQLRRQLEQVEDERKRERLEHEATVAELQARLSQAVADAASGPPAEKTADGVATSGISICASGPCVSIFRKSKSARGGNERNGVRRISSFACRDYGAGPARDEAAPTVIAIHPATEPWRARIRVRMVWIELPSPGKPCDGDELADRNVAGLRSLAGVGSLGAALRLIQSLEGLRERVLERLDSLETLVRQRPASAPAAAEERQAWTRPSS